MEDRAYMRYLTKDALDVVAVERAHAHTKHGPLRPGPARWYRLISEEYREAMDELAMLPVHPHLAEARERAITELAHLAQLCIGVIELIQAGQIQEEPRKGTCARQQ